jgi:peptidyl-prolyl cis-trans isomerase D
MLKSIQQRDLDRNRWIKISMGVILSIIILSMVVTLIPGLFGGGTDITNPDTVAAVDGQTITGADFQRQFEQLMRGQSVPDMMKSIYAKQVLDEMVYQRALAYEANRLGLNVTDQEETDRIKQILPTAWSGDTWLKDRYTTEVETRTGMSVPQFEEMLRSQMLEEKFRQLVTDGIKVSPAEVQQEFRWRNEKVKIDYALIKPSDLAATIHPSDAELSAWFQKNIGRYQIPEKRSARYALLDLAKLRTTIQPADAELRAYYNQNIDQYKVENRVHVEHILFKTVGKTDAEIAEIHQKAEDVLKQAQHGANFEDLAKRYSEDDASKPKGGDLGWIVEGQTVPEFQQAAFTLPKGSISDLVKTQYGFHIIKVLDHETAHTKTFEEVRDSIVQPVLEDKVSAQASQIADQMASAVRQSDRQSLDDLAKKFNLDVGSTPPVSITDPIVPLGNSPDLHQALFELSVGELSQPIQVESGVVIVTPKEILPAHQATLAEVHDQVLGDYQRENSVLLAGTRAQDLAKRTAGGESLDQAAKALGLDVKTSDSFARNGNVPDVGTGKQLEAAFGMKTGQVSQPVQLGDAWIVYRVAERDMPSQDDFAKQEKDIQQQLLQTKQNAAYEAFRAALVDRLKSEGKLSVNSDAVARLARSS